MKSMLYQAMEQAPSAEVVEPDVIARFYAKFDEQFFTYCDKELAMINTFYSGSLTFPIYKNYVQNICIFLLNFQKSLRRPQGNMLLWKVNFQLPKIKQKMKKLKQNRQGICS